MIGYKAMSIALDRNYFLLFIFRKTTLILLQKARLMVISLQKDRHKAISGVLKTHDLFKNLFTLGNGIVHFIQALHLPFHTIIGMFSYKSLHVSINCNLLIWFEALANV